MLNDRELAERLLDAGWLTFEQLRSAVPDARQRQLPLAQYLCTARLLTEEHITYLLACEYHLPYVRADQLALDCRAIALVPRALLRRYRIVPLRLDASETTPTLHIAMMPEAAADLCTMLSGTLGIQVLPVAASASALSRALDILDGKRSPQPHSISVTTLDLDTPARLPEKAA